MCVCTFNRCHMCMLITFCLSTLLCVCTFNRGTECDCVCECCGVKVYLTNSVAVRLSVPPCGGGLGSTGVLGVGLVRVVQMLLCCTGGAGW